jgi:hypothetical protein
VMRKGCLNDDGLPQSGTKTLPMPSERAGQRQPPVKLKIKRVYKNVPYEIEADINEIESAEQVSLMRQAEQFIDKMLEAEPCEGI